MVILPACSNAATRRSFSSPAPAVRSFGFWVQYFYYEYGTSTYQSSQSLTPPTIITLVCPTAA
ncbi:hypothetical protein ACFC6U_19390 [Kitasatospora purpeofusca]|uniref:hypothetical protein n=1 Tax=Kitasatospora purpeofusca TaxID=67352 RepID=UPI0035E27C8C